jgi:hypothetical protein
MSLLGGVVEQVKVLKRLYRHVLDRLRRKHTGNSIAGIDDVR